MRHLGHSRVVWNFDFLPLPVRSGVNGLPFASRGMDPGQLRDDFGEYVHGSDPALADELRFHRGDAYVPRDRDHLHHGLRVCSNEL
ncbi:hypothetical protein D3C74_402310 [compost metagenome]